MKSKDPQRQPQTTSTLTSFECDNTSLPSVRSSGNQSVELQQEVKKVLASGAGYSLENGSNSVCLMPSTHSVSAPFGQLSEDSEKNFVDALFDGTWRSVNPIGSDDLERNVSSTDSIDSEISSTCLDAVSSLEDVFDDLVDSVLDEMDDFGYGVERIVTSSTTCSPFRARSEMTMPITGSLIPPPIPPVHKCQSYRYEGLYQLPSPMVMGHTVANSFQGSNFGFVTGLQNPSRGLITVMRKLFSLLSKPRSDHLDSVFVRLLNNTVKEMEGASKPQPKRLRKKVAGRQSVPKRQRTNPRVCSPDCLSCSQPAHSGPRSYNLPSLRCHSYLSAVSKAEGNCIETVDLTSEEDKGREDCLPSQEHNEPLIALEDTVSDFMNGLFH